MIKPGWVVFGVLALLWTATASAQSGRWQDEAERRLSDIQERAESQLNDLAVQAELRAELESLMAVMAKVGSSRDEDLLIDLAATQRMLEIASADPESQAADWYRYLADESRLGRTLAFVFGENDKAIGVLRVLRELREEFGDTAVRSYPELVAALCVVHDEAELYSFRVNENRPRSAGPVALFRFFTENERRMLFGLQDVPAELLVFVVDATGDIEELEWALSQYQGDQAVGRLFHTIDYDTEHAELGRPKAVTRYGYTLPAISRLGGVCADQCHFAATVGKAIGVPTAYVSGVGGEVGHAWIGYLEAQGRNAAWNFNVGRYPEYQGVIGSVLDPQSGRNIGDDELGLTGRLANVSRDQRFEAAAWLDAAELLQNRVPAVDIGQSKSRTEPRVGLAGVLELAERALRMNPADRRGWAIVRTAVSDPLMPMADRTRWAQIIMRLCEEAGAEHFMVSMFEPMIESVEDPRARIETWDRVLSQVRTKKDLRARIRITQAKEYKRLDETNRAFTAYQDVIDSSLNDTRESRHAVAGAVGVLEEAGKHSEAARLLGRVLAMVERPGLASQFSSSSNYNFVRDLAVSYRMEHKVRIVGLE